MSGDLAAMLRPMFWSKRRVVLGAFFLALIVAKWGYQSALFHQLEAHMTARGASLAAIESVRSHELGIWQWIRLVPYAFLALFVLQESRTIFLGVLAGLALIGTDIWVDKMHEGWTDGQTGIGVAMAYWFFYVIIWGTFWGVNRLWKPSKHP